MPIAEGIAAAKLALDAGTKALDLLWYPKIDGEAVRNKITEMQDLVFSAQRALGDAEEENRQLRRQLDDREALKAVEADLEVAQEGGFYVKKSERERGIFNPYCPVCFGTTKQAIPLVPMANGWYCCDIHKTASYKTTSYRDQEGQRLAQEKIDESSFSIMPGPFGRHR